LFWFVLVYFFFSWKTISSSVDPKFSPIITSLFCPVAIFSVVFFCRVGSHLPRLLFFLDQICPCFVPAGLCANMNPVETPFFLRRPPLFWSFVILFLFVGSGRVDMFLFGRRGCHIWYFYRLWAPPTKSTFRFVHPFLGTMVL